MESTLTVATRHSVGEKKSRGHRKGEGKRAQQSEFGGYTIAEVLKLGRKPLHRLTPKEIRALEEYWESRLAVMGLGVERGRSGLLTFQPDIGVRDHSNPGSGYFLPGTEEESDDEEWQGRITGKNS